MSYRIKIDESAPCQKFLQIVDQVKQALDIGKITAGERLPSINSLSKSAGVSRDTVEKSYKKLKELGLIISIPGKGVYVSGTFNERKKSVVSSGDEHAKILYTAMTYVIDGESQADLQIHRRGLCMDSNVSFAELLKRDKSFLDNIDL